MDATTTRNAPAGIIETPDGYLSKWSEWSLAHPGADIIG